MLALPDPSQLPLCPDGSAPPPIRIPALFRQPQNTELGRSQVLSPTPVPGEVREVQKAQRCWLKGLGSGDRRSPAKGKTLHGLGCTMALYCRVSKERCLGCASRAPYTRPEP